MIYKVITNVLVNRLKIIMPGIINCSGCNLLLVLLKVEYFIITVGGRFAKNENINIYLGRTK